MRTVFEQYYKRLAKEGWLKAFLWGLFVGFLSLFTSAAVIWFVGWEFTQWWKPTLICAGVWVLMTAMAMLTFYFARFRPSEKEVAVRVDALGLEERMLTMHQLQGDNSYMAQRQREDAVAALKAFNPKLIRFAISTSLIIMTVISGVVGMGMTTVSALTAEGILEGGNSFVEELITPEPNQYEVLYEVDGEGFIEGEFFQVVEEGKNALGVLAVAEEGWMFAGWMDAETQGLAGEDPYREDFDVRKNITLIAVFQEAEPQDGDGDGDGEGASGMPGEADEGAGQPSESDSSSSSNSNSSSSSSSGTPSDSDGPGGGAYEENNQVIDGETYYGGSTYDNAYGDAMDEVSGNGDISDAEGDIVGDYFDTIEK